MSTLTQTFTSACIKNKGWLLTSVCAAYLAYKISKLHCSKHQYMKLGAVDSTLFPQFIQTKQGLWLHHKKWEITNPKGIIFIVHGKQIDDGDHRYVQHFILMT
jgi:hypothetical protein